MLRKFLGDYSIDKRAFLVLTILFLSVIGWFYMTLPMMNHIIDVLNPTHGENLAIWAIFYISLVAASIVGTFVSSKVSRLKFLYTWTIVGAIVSLLPIFVVNGDFSQIWILSLLLGSTFGLGVPTCLAYFTDYTVVENRGRIGGITLLIANLSVPILAVLFNEIDFALVTLIFATLRGLGLVVFFQKPEKQQAAEKKRDVSYMSILRDRTFMLYFVAWSMFPLVDRFESALVVPYLTDAYANGTLPNLLGIMDITEPVVATISLVIAGVLCDWIGRKKIVLSGFVAIGAAYGIIGLIPQFELSWYIYMVVDGVAWGIFLLIFFVIIWGDIAQSYKSVKYYTIGSIPYFLSSIVPTLLTQSFIDNVEVSAAFSVASFFLFVAVMPLVFAPETLPEKKMELRRLRSFADEARKMKEKYEGN